MNAILRATLPLAALLLGSCSRPSAPERGPAATPGASGPRPSVVLVLVDQLRRDAAERWMPETRALAERGIRCEEMRSVAPWTYPSVISLLSGLYPQQHGADANQEGTRVTTISPDVPLLPRTLRAAGYHTAGFVTNPFLHEWNAPVRSCFEKFDASFIGDQGPTRGHGDVVWTERMYSNTVNPHVRAYFDARPLAGPEFTYVHYIDVHGRREGPGQWKNAPFRPTYEDAVRYVDGKVHELYEYFLERYDGNCLFVVTSDHGQDLDDDVTVGDGEQWRKRKASLHDFNLRIPFFVLPSRLVETPRVITQPCANVDVTPTLLEWLGLPPQSQGPGTSLLGAIRGQAYDGEARTLYARNSTGGRLEECIVHAHRKLMHYLKPDDGTVVATRLFDLAGDPRELHGLTGGESDMTALLEAAADPHGVRFEARFEELDPATLRSLDDLGYGGKTDESSSASEPEHGKKKGQ